MALSRPNRNVPFRAKLVRLVEPSVVFTAAREQSRAGPELSSKMIVQ